MSGARLARNAAAVVVAGIAAWSSYSHMVHVALRFGERPEVAWLLPFSVDGMLVVASVAMVAMVDDKRCGRRVRPMARVAFAAGVVASIAANIAAAQPTWGARIVAAWPALALLLVVEMLSRSGRALPTTAPAAAKAQVEPAPVSTPSPREFRNQAGRPHPQHGKRLPGHPNTPPSGRPRFRSGITQPLNEHSLGLPPCAET